MDRRRVWALVAAVAVIGAVVYAIGGQPGNRASRAKGYRQEPTVSVFIKESGEKRSMPMEEYIAGVVAGEMRPGWPKEAYAAQAIIARTFTMEFMDRGGTRQEHGTDVSNDPEEAQAYRPENITPIIREAVKETRGEVITYKGDFIRAWFHAYSGGQTATAKEGLAFAEQDPPYIQSIKLPENTVAPEDVKRWRFEMPLSEVGAKLREKGINVGEVQSLRIAAKGPSGRATQIEVRHSGATTSIPGPNFRLAMGAEFGMRSTLIDRFEVTGGKLVAEGRGFGHGVGMSQWDALQMAREGKSAEEIVKTFFRDVQIEKLWD